MKPEDFDLMLAREMGELPPEPGTLENYTPWQQAISKVLWGTALTTFLFNFFYLNYLLPLLGGTLLYLGFRSLRRENRWFTLCWALAGARLGWQMVYAVLSATPLIDRLAGSSANLPLSFLICAANTALLFALRAGIRTAFVSTGGGRPKDWLGRGLCAYLLSMAIALWSELVPLTEPSLFFGPSIAEEWQWLYYGRGIAFIALQIYLLTCIFRQSEALAGRGYQVRPTPVRFSGRAILLGVFSGVLFCLPPALWLGGQISNGPAAEPEPLTAEQTAVRDRLIRLGLPEYLASSLDGQELALCARAERVKPADYIDCQDEDGQRISAPFPLPVALASGQASLSVWVVELPGNQARYYCCFRYERLPSLRLQEQFSLDPSSNIPIDHFSARLIWTQSGQTFTACPQVHLAGGQTAENLDEDPWAVMFPDTTQYELDRLGGHLQYRPWFNFSIPRGAEGLTGYLAYTADLTPSAASSPAGGGEALYDSVYVFLRHQFRLLHYPFVSISDLGGSRNGGDYGPITSAWGMFEFLY